MTTVKARLEELESGHRRIKVEWEDVLDRMERMMGRLNKRAQRDAPAAAANGTAHGESESTPSPADMVRLRRSGRGGPGGLNG